MYATYIFPRLMDWVLRDERFQTERRLLLTPIFLLLPAIPVALVLMLASADGLNPAQAVSSSHTDIFSSGTVL